MSKLYFRNPLIRAGLAFLPHLSLVLVEPVDVDEDGEDEDDDGDEEGGAAGELVVGPVRRMDIMRELYTCSILVKRFLSSTFSSSAFSDI